MECRRTVVVGLGLLFGLSGCLPLRESHHELVSPDKDAEPLSERELPKRQPKSKTCLEYGRLQESEAHAANRSPAERAQMLELARQMYQQALEIDPKNISASLALARLHESRGDHDRAVTTYQKALKSYPKDGSVWTELGMCHGRHKEWEPALKCLRTAADLDPENRQTAQTLGFCLARAGRYEESLVCFTKTVGEAKAHYNLARMLLHMQQEELGREHLRLAMAKDPQLSTAKELLAELDAERERILTTIPATFEEFPLPPQGPTSLSPDGASVPSGLPLR